MKKSIKDLLLSLFITLCILFCLIQGAKYFGKQLAIYIDKTTFQEIRALHTFQNDPRNKGQYIMDFDTGIWYDIDGLNPDVPPLTISEMDIKNIRERILAYGQKTPEETKGNAN